MTVVVTGAAGFIARHLATVLRGTSAQTRLVGIDARPIDGGVFDETLTVDLSDREATGRLVGEVAPSAVFHLVGGIRGTDDFIHASNVVTARNVLDATRRFPRARIVLVGSAAEYGAVPATQQPVVEKYVGAPTTSYGRAKAEVSSLAAASARDRHQQVMVARPFNVLGPGVSDALVGGAIIHRLRSAIAGPPPRRVRIGRTTAVRDFVAVEDVAVGLARIAELGRPGEAYNLCTGEGHSVAELLDRLLALAAERVEVQQDAGLMRAGDVDMMIGSREKAMRELGWSPRLSFDDCVRGAWAATDATGTLERA